jgi:hypothetical protein
MFAHRIELIVQQVRWEFAETPDLRLTLEQAQTWFDIDAPTAAAVFSAFVDAGYLLRTDDGGYVQRPGVGSVDLD